MRYSITRQALYNTEKIQEEKMKDKSIRSKITAILSMMVAFLLATIIPVKLTAATVFANGGAGSGGSGGGGVTGDNPG